MKTTQEMIAVMQAYVDGKKIECYNKIDSTKEKISIMRSYAEGKETETIDANVTNTVIFDSPIWGPLWDWIHYDYQIKEEQFTPKFNIGDLVVDKKYQNKMVILRYEGNKPVVYYANEEVAVDENVLEFYKEPTREEITAQWVKDNDVKEGDHVWVRDRGVFNVDSILGNKILIDLGVGKDFFDVEELKKVTREEITAQWVRDNDVKKGDKVIYVGEIDKSTNPEFLEAAKNITFEGLMCSNGGVSVVDISGKSWGILVEELKKVTKKVVPFTFEDRYLFRGKWVRKKGSLKEELIVAIMDGHIHIGVHTSYKYSMTEACEELEFIDGNPFGKEIWE